MRSTAACGSEAESAPLVAVVSRCAWTLYNFRLPLLRAIAAAGHRVIALGRPLGGFESKLLSAGVAFEALPISTVGFNPLADARLMIALTRFFARTRPSIVHAFTVRPAIFATIAARMAGVPVRIVTVTGLGHAFTTAGVMTRWMTERLYRAALAQADVVFFQNSEDRELFVERRLVARGRTRLVPGSGVSLERFALKPLRMADGGPPTFLMMGRLLREKGIVEFLEAADIVKREFPATRFLLVGGADSHNPSSLSAVEIDAIRHSRNVTWLGEIEDVRPCIEDADVIVLPSYREGVPRSLLEGAAMGRALVATDVPGCREIVEDGATGLLVAPRDPQGLAAAMSRLVRDRELLGALAGHAHQKVAAEFDERLVLDATLSAYDEMLGRKCIAAQPG